MTNKKAYENLINSYNLDNNVFASAAMTLADKVKENPFDKGSDAYNAFNDMVFHYNRWKKGGVGDKISLRRTIEKAKELAKLNASNPFTEENEQEEIKQEIKEKEEKINQKREEEIQERFEKNEDIEVIQDIRYVMLAMVKAYNEGNEVNFKQFAIHLVDIAEENPFVEGTEEFSIFAEMVMVYRRKPANIRRVHVLAEKLCKIINTTEVYPEKIQKKEKKTVLGVLPEEDKKSWFKFLHPWKKEGENDDN